MRVFRTDNSEILSLRKFNMHSSLEYLIHQHRLFSDYIYICERVYMPFLYMQHIYYTLV